MERPAFIRHWRELEGPDTPAYPNDANNARHPEWMAIGAPIGRALGLTRIGVHHERLPPGRRLSYPHAESQEEEFVYVLEGEPHAWIDGHLHALRPGDAIAFPAGTGICHTFINDTTTEVRLLVVGESAKATNRIRYPLNEAFEQTRKDAWRDWPSRPMGPHDGRPQQPGQKRHAIDPKNNR